MKTKVIVEHEIRYVNEYCDLDCPGLEWEEDRCAIFNEHIPYRESKYFRCNLCREATDNTEKPLIIFISDNGTLRTKLNHAFINMPILEQKDLIGEMILHLTIYLRNRQKQEITETYLKLFSVVVE